MTSTAIIEKYITGIVLLVVAFQVVVGLIPPLQDALNNISVLGLPLGTLFSPTGIIMTILFAGLFLMAYKSFFSMGRKK